MTTYIQVVRHPGGEYRAMVTGPDGICDIAESSDLREAIHVVLENSNATHVMCADGSLWAPDACSLEEAAEAITLSNEERLT